jgi:hypothetical protein
MSSPVRPAARDGGSYNVIPNSPRRLRRPAVRGPSAEYGDTLGALEGGGDWRRDRPIAGSEYSPRARPRHSSLFAKACRDRSCFARPTPSRNHRPGRPDRWKSDEKQFLRANETSPPPRCRFAAWSSPSPVSFCRLSFSRSWSWWLALAKIFRGRRRNRRRGGNQDHRRPPGWRAAYNPRGGPHLSRRGAGRRAHCGSHIGDGPIRYAYKRSCERSENRAWPAVAHISEEPSSDVPMGWIRKRPKTGRRRRRREEKNNPGYATAALLTVIHNHMQEYFFANRPAGATRWRMMKHVASASHRR